LNWLALLLVLHLGGMAFWLGGMGFLLLVMRPASGFPETGPVALQILLFQRLVSVMSYSMPITLATGWIIAYLAYGRPLLWPWALNAMQTTGLAMAGLALLIRFGPYAMLREAHRLGDQAEMTVHGERITRLTAISCGLGGLSLVFAVLLHD
jgi:putative copper export protein